MHKSFPIGQCVIPCIVTCSWQPTWLRLPDHGALVLIVHQPPLVLATVGDTGCADHVPGAGHRGHAVQAQGLLAAALQGDGLDVVCWQNDQPRLGRVLVSNQQIEHGHSLTEDLNLGLDDGRLHVGLVGPHQCLDDAAPVGAHVEDIVHVVIDVTDAPLGRYPREQLPVTELNEDGRHRPRDDGLVHQAVVLDEVEAGLRDAEAVVVTLAWPGTRHLPRGHGQPVRVDSLLILEVPVETLVEVAQRKSAHSAAENWIGWCREDSIKYLIVERIWEEIRCWLNLIKVERIFSGNWTV